MSGSSKLLMIDVRWGIEGEAAAEINFQIPGGFNVAPAASSFSFPIERNNAKKKRANLYIRLTVQ